MSMTLLFSLLVITAEPTAAWPGFLGAGATSINSQTIPLQWSPTENRAWSRPLPGYGQSSPVIWQDHVYVTTVDGPKKEFLHVLCISLTDGTIVWDKTFDSTYPQESSVYISRAAPTPVADADGIYAYFESGDVIALSHSGDLRWQRSLTKDFGPPQNEFGLSASPVQTGDRIFILIDDLGPSYLIALDKPTGKTAWKTDRASRKSWTSPALIPFGDRWQIVVSSDGSVAGYDPANGQQLWDFTDVGGNTGTSPIPVADGTFLISASPGSEGKKAAEAKKSNGLMSATRSGDAWEPKFLWTNPNPTPSWGSPIAHQGNAYWVNRVGAIFCLNAASGELVYTERAKQGCWATPVGLGDRIYIFGKDGLTSIIAAGNEFKVLAENELWTAEEPPVNNVPKTEEKTPERQRSSGMFLKPTVYGVAIVDGSIILRTGSQLFCIRAAKSPADTQR